MVLRHGIVNFFIRQFKLFNNLDNLYKIIKLISIIDENFFYKNQNVLEFSTSALQEHDNYPFYNPRDNA